MPCRGSTSFVCSSMRTKVGCTVSPLPLILQYWLEFSNCLSSTRPVAIALCVKRKFPPWGFSYMVWVMSRCPWKTAVCINHGQTESFRGYLYQNLRIPNGTWEWPLLELLSSAKMGVWPSNLVMPRSCFAHTVLLTAVNPQNSHVGYPLKSHCAKMTPTLSRDLISIPQTFAAELGILIIF